MSILQPPSSPKILVQNCLPVLVAPAWPTQFWFSLLLEMSVDNPLRLPLSPKLLKQIDKPFFHSKPGHLNLHAWKLQEGISRNNSSVKNFLTESWTLMQIYQEIIWSKMGYLYCSWCKSRKRDALKAFSPLIADS